MFKNLFKRKDKSEKRSPLPPYSLIRSDRKTVGLQIKCGELIVRAPRRMREEDITAFIYAHRDWVETHLEIAKRREEQNKGQTPLTREELNGLYERARVIIPERVEYYANILGVSYGRITIRNQRTRWGSCSGKGNLNFNCLLVLTPPEVLDYVVIHELCHRKEMNHSSRFYAEIAKIMPDYKKHQAWLRERGGALLKRAEINHG